MAMRMDQIKWNLYLKKRRLLFYIGLTTGLIHGYEKELVENLRKKYYGGIPISIILLCEEMCNERCYDRALLMTFGFDEDYFEQIDADVDSITLNPKYIEENRKYPFEHYGNHSFIERTKKDGSVWVYDTSLGLVIEKKLYYLLENPKITKRNTKSQVKEFCEYKDIQNANPEKDKYVSPIILKFMELFIKPEHGFYYDALKEEIQIFKDSINYDSLCQEIHDDMVAKGIRRGK